MSRLTTFLKNLLISLLILSAIPSVVMVLSKQYKELTTPTAKVALMHFNQPLMNSGEYVKNLKKFFKDTSVKAIVLKMDCPGGAAGTSQAIFGELVCLKKEYPHKPVIVFVENMCASGGYYIASAADWIIATGSSFIGSVGVYIAKPHLKNFIEQFKLEYDFTRTGDYKTVLNPFAPRIEKEKDHLQELCDDTYHQFITDVSNARPLLELKKANLWANGKIFTGAQALNMKLVDQLGAFAHVEQEVRNRAHIPAHQEIQWVKAEQKNIIMKLLFPDDNEVQETLSAALTSALSNALQASHSQPIIAQL